MKNILIEKRNEVNTNQKNFENAILMFIQAIHHILVIQNIDKYVLFLVTLLFHVFLMMLSHILNVHEKQHLHLYQHIPKSHHFHLDAIEKINHYFKNIFQNFL